MKYKINKIEDIDETEDAIIGLKDAIELLEEFKEKYKNLVEQIKEENIGKFIDSIDTNVQEEIELIENVVENGKEITGGAEKYLDKIEEINAWTGQGVYEVSEDVVREAIKDFKEILEWELRGNTRGIESYMEDFEFKKREFNSVDNSIDEEEEYEDEEDTISYIKRRRSEIDNQIRDYDINSDILEEADDVMLRLEEKLGDLI